MKRNVVHIVVLASTLAGSISGSLAVAQSSSDEPASAPEAIAEVLQELNASPTVQGSEGIKSYKILFDAYLDLSDPPMPIGDELNLARIHPGMPRWDEVSSWAEANPEMAQAILDCKNRRIVGLPYGRDNVPQPYQYAGLMVDIGGEGSLRNNDFAYLHAVETIGAFAAAETYRLLEAGQVQAGLDLAVAHLALSRQFCDREFLQEKLHSISLLTESLSNLRDIFYLYQDEITAEQYRDIAVGEIPFLRPDRNALFMPEGDRIVSEELIKEVFNSRGMADPEKFQTVFGEIQSREAPLTRFGAARRWEMIAQVHGSLEASLERLQLVYDDWWRRWRVQEYDPILDIETQFERTNAIRYAAVIYSMENIESLFEIRKELIVAVNGTAVAGGLCAYLKTFGNIPEDHKRTYAQFVRKSSDVDPYDRNYDALRYLYVTSRHPIDTPHGRVWVEPGEGILYSLGQNFNDDRAARHTYDGLNGDIVVWPPIKALARQQDLIN